MFVNQEMEIVKAKTLSSYPFVLPYDLMPANTQRNEYVIITQKRRFDVLIPCLLRFVFVGLNFDRMLC